METPSLEEHFEKLGRKVGGIEALHVYGRYSFMDRYAVDLRVSAIRDSVLFALDEEVDDDLTMLRDFLYKPGSLNFVKAINLLQLMGDDKRKVALDYAKGYLSDFWSVEHDEYRILPRNYVEAIVQGEEVPLYVFQLSRVLDVSYLKGPEKKSFILNLCKYQDLGERLKFITNFNLGLFKDQFLEGGQLNLDEVVSKTGDEEDSDVTLYSYLERVVSKLSAVTSLGLSGLHVDASKRSVIDLLVGCPNKDNIESLDLSYSITRNHVLRIDSIGLPMLKELYMRGCRGDVYPNSPNFEFMKQLRVLDMSGSNIAYGDMFFSLLSMCTEMEELYLRNVKIRDVSETVFKMPNLRLLDISKLNIDNRSRATYDLPALEDLRANGFSIGVGSGPFNWDTPNLKHLDYGGQDLISTLPNCLTNYLGQLVSLNLQGSRMEHYSLISLLNRLGSGLKFLSLPESEGRQVRLIWDEIMKRFSSIEALGFVSPADELFTDKPIEIPESLRELKLVRLRNSSEKERDFSGIGKSNLEYLGVETGVEPEFLPRYHTVQNLPETIKVVEGAVYPEDIVRRDGLIYVSMGWILPPESSFYSFLARQESSVLGLSVYHSYEPNFTDSEDWKKMKGSTQYGSYYIVTTDMDSGANELTQHYYY